METVQYSTSLKNELKKKQFIDYFVKKFESLNVDGQVFEVALVLCRSAEDWFHSSKNKRKNGSLKKQAVIDALKALNHTRKFDDAFFSQLIESICENHEIKPNSLLYRTFRLFKKSLLAFIKK
jgi:hypothetical protein